MEGTTNEKLGMSLDALIQADKKTKLPVKHDIRRNDRQPRARSDRSAQRVQRKEDSDDDVNMESKRRERSPRPRQTGKWSNSNSGWKTDRGSAWGKMVKVTNVPYDLTWQDVKDAFKSAGPVERVELDKGVAWVKFSDARDASTAVKTYDGGEMNGRTIKVAIA